MTASRSLPASPAATTPPAASPLGDVEARLVDGLVHGRLALPVLPEVSSRALELANDPSASVGDFVALIEKDPPIAARFLSTANSAYYSRGVRVSRLDQAVVRIGLLASRDLLFQIVYGNSTSGLRRFKALVTASFQRSVVAAVATLSASQVIGPDYPDAYLCGLLHDIGESRVLRILDGLKTAQPLTTDDALALVARHHAGAGAEITSEWRLPDEIVEVCRAHHAPPGRSRPHVRLVQIADAVVPAALASLGGRPAALDPAALAPLGVDPVLAERVLHLTVERAQGLE